ncbi:MAG: hypothetical protein AVDCRST_MAG93-6167, partial [uncultured Chloroflexia bacterium]
TRGWRRSTPRATGSSPWGPRGCAASSRLLPSAPATWSWPTPRATSSVSSRR